MALIEIENSGTDYSGIAGVAEMWFPAQTFTPINSFILQNGSIRGIGLEQDNEPHTYPSGILRVEIWDTRPTSTVDFTNRLIYVEIDVTEFPLRYQEQDWPWPFGWVDIVFPQEPEPTILVAGHVYWLVIRRVGQPERVNMYLPPVKPGLYTGGIQYTLAIGSTQNIYISSYYSDRDLQFKLSGQEFALNLVSPVDNATEVHSKDTLLAEVVGSLDGITVSSVQLYLNTVKVYDGGPQGAKPYLQWMVGVYCQPNTGYDWYVTATIDNVLYTSEIWTFTTAEKQDLHPSFSWWGTTPTNENWGESPPAYDIYFGTDPTGVDLDLVVDNWVEPEWVWGEGEWTGGAGGHWTAVGSGDGTPAEPDWPWYPLEYDTAYYWKINTGPVYTFTTMAFATPQWETKYLRLVAAANGKIWYEDV